MKAYLFTLIFLSIANISFPWKLIYLDFTAIAILALHKISIWCFSVLKNSKFLENNDSTLLVKSSPPQQYLVTMVFINNLFYLNTCKH